MGKAIVLNLDNKFFWGELDGILRDWIETGLSGCIAITRSVGDFNEHWWYELENDDLRPIDIMLKSKKEITVGVLEDIEQWLSNRYYLHSIPEETEDGEHFDATITPYIEEISCGVNVCKLRINFEIDF